MQTQTFETSKGTLLTIRLPEGSFGMIINNYGDESELMYTIEGDDDSLKKIKLPPGDWKEIGLWGQIEEERAVMIIEDRISIPRYDIFGYQDYMGRVPQKVHETALESLQSLLEMKIWFRNMWGKKPEFTIWEYGVSPVAYEFFEDDLKEWQAAESKVWKHFYLIFKTK